MKKYLSLLMVVMMVLSIGAITASADGFYPVDGGTFNVIGDWDFEEATIAENLSIPADWDGTVTYADGGVKFAQEAGGTFPALQFVPSKVTSAPAASDYVFYEFTVDMREVAQNEIRFNIYASGAENDAGYIVIKPDAVYFRARGGTAAGTLFTLGNIPYIPAADESRTKVGMLVNLSSNVKYYAGYINGELVCEHQFGENDKVRSGYLTGKVDWSYLNPLEGAGDYAITFYDYKLYKGADKTELPYAKIAEKDLSQATLSGGTDGTYTFSNTNGINLTMTEDATMPKITIPGQALPGTSYTTDMFYYEFVVNSGKLSDESEFVICLNGTSSKLFFAVGVQKNKLTFQRGNGNQTLLTGGKNIYDIPAELVGTDIKIGLLIDQNDGSKGQTYVYINREYFWKTGNNDRTSYHPFAQAITITNYVVNGSTILFDTTQTTGDEIVVKSVNVYHCAEGATPVVTPVIPTEGAFTATASYSVDSIAAADGSVTATVTLSKVGNAGWYNKDLVIVASYAANGALLDYQVADGKVSGGSTATISKTVEVEAGGEVKVFLWDDMKTLVPTATFDVLD